MFVVSIRTLSGRRRMLFSMTDMWYCAKLTPLISILPVSKMRSVVLGDTRNFMPRYVSWKSIAILDTIAFGMHTECSQNF